MMKCKCAIITASFAPTHTKPHPWEVSRCGLKGTNQMWPKETNQMWPQGDQSNVAQEDQSAVASRGPSDQVTMGSNVAQGDQSDVASMGPIKCGPRRPIRCSLNGTNQMWPKETNQMWPQWDQVGSNHDPRGSIRHETLELYSITGQQLVMLASIPQCSRWGSAGREGQSQIEESLPRAWSQ